MKNAEKLTVLIVDADAEERELVKNMLLRNHFRVFEAYNAIRAMELAEAHRPEIVLMSVQLPDMDGYECCRRIKSFISLKNVRVIMIAEKGGFEISEQAYQHGAGDFVTKPVDEDELLQKIERMARFIKISNTTKSTMKRMSNGSDTGR
ncbi:MAG: response regulator [Deltaproteobacteria bacterium]|nr:response regulator [Deltaproteobacteria bacterium]